MLASGSLGTRYGVECRFDTERSPCGERNASSSNKVANTDRSWSGGTMDNSSRRVSPAPRTRQSIIWLRPCRSIIRARRLRRRCSRSRFRPGTAMAGKAGIAPTRLCTDRLAGSGRVGEPVVEEPVGRVVAARAAQRVHDHH